MSPNGSLPGLWVSPGEKPKHDDKISGHRAKLIGSDGCFRFGRVSTRTGAIMTHVLQVMMETSFVSIESKDSFGAAHSAYFWSQIVWAHLKPPRPDIL